MDPRRMARFHVQSSDVLADMRVNVSEEGSDRVLWFKERFLADDEIIEHLVNNATSTIQWSIHRPKRGWYIRMRTPSFPPGMFISLQPLPQGSPYYADAALMFACRTNPPSYSLSTSQMQPCALTRSSLESDITVTSARDAIHSYPPMSPPQTPTVVIRPPSPESVQEYVEEAAPTASSSTPGISSRPPPTPLTPITHFLLTPHSAAHIPKPTEKVSIFTRVVSALKNNVPSHSYSFTLSPVPGPSAPAIPPLPNYGHHSHHEHGPPTPIPLLTFHDRTPVFTVRNNTGVIELDTDQVRSLGVEASFYVAVALTYLEFLSERDSFLAALGD
ncbi:uncharacterized protein LAESUDRAFT_555677 [Laetiporus sulphureus 93-53]|uniref:Uncharacterized protein n=1 Tax=Laetiporus sulphureus 93-53 TaxID=1314785 RepID=A0A165B6S0_9APHY|nr:uncharacterized protein LAESUDRAFT_555677 [Laetiporus sulphureus 93-53]KZT00371.1 hypothetical protein LAESUDRAFT_555677 [Laetiporus sulphureus 93-53]